MKNRFLILSLLLLVGACQTRLEYPPVISPDEVQSVSKMTVQRPLMFDSGVISLKRGYPYVAFPFWRWSTPNVDVWFYMCNSSVRNRFKRSLAYWKEGDVLTGSWKTELAEYVETPLEEMGYDIVSSRKTMFKQQQEMQRAEISFAAKIVDIQINACNIYSWWDGGSQNTAGGDAYVKVDWEFYDPLRKRVITNMTTEGVGKLDDTVTGGIDLLLLSAVRDASRNLGQTRAFYNLMTDNHYVAAKNPRQYKYLGIEADKKPYVKDISEQYEFIRRGVITVRTASGHGSAFFINPDGYALTNAHVVGDAKTVAILDYNGVQYMADVLRVDEERDVALIKADITRNAYFPVSAKYMKVTDTVYALGTPLSESMRATITKGIISAIRYWQKDELSFYQVDAEIAPGSSGGPLTDAFGNVIGIAVQGRGIIEKSATPYAYFIPIADAMKYLNIHMTKPDLPL